METTLVFLISGKCVPSIGTEDKFIISQTENRDQIIYSTMLYFSELYSSYIKQLQSCAFYTFPQ